MADAILLASARLADRSGTLPGVSDAQRVFGCPGLPLRARPVLGMRLYSKGRLPNLSRAIAKPETARRATCLDGSSIPLSAKRSDRPQLPRWNLARWPAYGQFATDVPRPLMAFGLVSSTWNLWPPTDPSR